MADMLRKPWLEAQLLAALVQAEATSISFKAKGYLQARSFHNYRFDKNSPKYNPDELIAADISDKFCSLGCIFTREIEEKHQKETGYRLSQLKGAILSKCQGYIKILEDTSTSSLYIALEIHDFNVVSDVGGPNFGEPGWFNSLASARKILNSYKVTRLVRPQPADFEDIRSQVSQGSSGSPEFEKEDIGIQTQVNKFMAVPTIYSSSPSVVSNTPKIQHDSKLTPRTGILASSSNPENNLGKRKRLHSGWGDFQDLTYYDCQIPASQQKILDTEDCWMPKGDYVIETIKFTSSKKANVSEPEQHLQQSRIRPEQWLDQPQDKVEGRCGQIAGHESDEQPAASDDDIVSWEPSPVQGPSKMWQHGEKSTEPELRYELDDSPPPDSSPIRASPQQFARKMEQPFIPPPLTDLHNPEAHNNNRASPSSTSHSQASNFRQDTKIEDNDADVEHGISLSATAAIPGSVTSPEEILMQPTMPLRDSAENIVDKGTTISMNKAVQAPDLEIPFASQVGQKHPDSPESSNNNVIMPRPEHAEEESPLATTKLELGHGQVKVKPNEESERAQDDILETSFSANGKASESSSTSRRIPWQATTPIAKIVADQEFRRSRSPQVGATNSPITNPYDIAARRSLGGSQDRTIQLSRPWQNRSSPKLFEGVLASHRAASPSHGVQRPPQQTKAPYNFTSPRGTQKRRTSVAASVSDRMSQNGEPRRNLPATPTALNGTPAQEVDDSQSQARSVRAEPAANTSLARNGSNKREREVEVISSTQSTPVRQLTKKRKIEVFERDDDDEAGWVSPPPRKIQRQVLMKDSRKEAEGEEDDHEVEVVEIHDEEARESTSPMPWYEDQDTPLRRMLRTTLRTFDPEPLDWDVMNWHSRMADLDARNKSRSKRRP